MKFLVAPFVRREGQSLYCRGTQDIFVDLSDQEHAPRVFIHFAVADVRRPIFAVMPLIQRGLRINKEVNEATSISRGGVSIQCKTPETDLMSCASALSLACFAQVSFSIAPTSCIACACRQGTTVGGLGRPRKDDDGRSPGDCFR